MEVVTDQAATYPAVLDELLPAAWHRTEQYANNRIEADHGRLKDPVRRLDLIAAETAERKQHPHPQGASGVMSLAVVQRAVFRLLARQRLVNLYVTNVPGPPVPLYLAGARLLELFPMVPIEGNLTLTLGVFSYAGQLNLTAVAERDACPDIEVFAQRLGRVSGSGGLRC